MEKLCLNPTPLAPSPPCNGGEGRGEVVLFPLKSLSMSFRGTQNVVSFQFFFAWLTRFPQGNVNLIKIKNPALCGSRVKKNSIRLFSLLLPVRPQNGAIPQAVGHDLGVDDDSAKHRIHDVSGVKRTAVIYGQHCRRKYFDNPSCQPPIVIHWSKWVHFDTVLVCSSAFSPIHAVQN